MLLVVHRRAASARRSRSPTSSLLPQRAHLGRDGRRGLRLRRQLGSDLVRADLVRRRRRVRAGVMTIPVPRRQRPSHSQILGHHGGRRRPVARARRGSSAASSRSCVGMPLMRLSGLAAGVATFAVLGITHNVLRDWPRSGPAPRRSRSCRETTGPLQPTIGAASRSRLRSRYERSRLGRSCRATRENAAASEAAGATSTASGCGPSRSRARWRASRAGSRAPARVARGRGGLLELTFVTLAMLVIGGGVEPLGAMVGALVVSGLDSSCASPRTGVNVG